MNCGAICLQHIHRGHGHRMSLRKARALCKTTRNGTRASDMMTALTALGYRNVRLKRKMRWSDLQREVASGNHVLVIWWSDLDSNGVTSAADGHWSAVERVTADTIELFDPDPEETVTLPKSFFYARWYDYEKDEFGNRDDFIRAAVIARYSRIPKTR